MPMGQQQQTAVHSAVAAPHTSANLADLLVRVTPCLLLVAVEMFDRVCSNGRVLSTDTGRRINWRDGGDIGWMNLISFPQWKPQKLASIRPSIGNAIETHNRKSRINLQSLNSNVAFTDSAIRVLRRSYSPNKETEIIKKWEIQFLVRGSRGKQEPYKCSRKWGGGE